MGIHPFLTRVIQRIREIPTRGLPMFHSEPSSFDSEWGVETNNLVWLTSPFSKNYGQGHRYEACNPEACKWAIEASGIDTREFYFLDVGCGKGRPLLIASRFPFPRLIGIDFSKKLCSQAIINLKKYDIPKERWEILCQDAADYIFPEHALFVYLYNPFGCEIVARVMENLRSVATRYPVYVAFEGQNRFLLEQCPWLESR